MTVEEFARPTFKGGRFDTGEGMPVEALPDLAAYADIITDVAKSLFKQRHPGRQRVSRGFEDRLQLRVSHVEEGSKIPVLERRLPEGELAIPDEYDDARDLVTQAIAAASSGHALPAGLPASVLTKFSRLGQRLQPGERIVFATKQGGEAVYDRTVRTRLVQMGGKAYSSRDEFVGYVSDLDSQRGRVEIRTADGVSLGGEYREFWEVFHAAQGSPPETGRRVRVDAETEYDAAGEPQRFLVVHEVTTLDTWEWAERRLAELGTIEQGWFDGEHGEPVDEAAFDAAGGFLEALADTDVSPPHLFPTPDGGIQAQWRDDANTVSVEFEPGGRTALHSLNVENGDDQYIELESAYIDRAVRFVVDATRAAS